MLMPSDNAEEERRQWDGMAPLQGISSTEKSPKCSGKKELDSIGMKKGLWSRKKDIGIMKNGLCYQLLRSKCSTQFCTNTLMYSCV